MHAWVTYPTVACACVVYVLFLFYFLRVMISIDHIGSELVPRKLYVVLLYYYMHTSMCTFAYYVK